MTTQWNRPRQRWQRLVAAWRGYDQEKALRDELHRGIAIGKQHATTTYEQRCGIHHLLLEQIAPGRFRCWLCLEIDAQQRQWSGPIKVPVGDLARAYNKDNKHYQTNFRLATHEQQQK